MQKKQGISLIVLVITIIVMIILAAPVVITLSNTGVINRANQAVDLTNEAQVRDLAALTWADAYMDNLRGETLVTKVITQLGEQGITTDKWLITVTDSGVTIKDKNNLTLGDFITSAGDYGKTVDYVSDNGVTGWKIFYHTDEYIYLIASEKIYVDKIPTILEDSSIQAKIGTGGYIYWPSGINPVGVELSERSKEIWMANWLDYEQKLNSKAATHFLDENVWKTFKNSTASYQEYVVGAVGTPTAEMFVASWNAKREAMLLLQPDLVYTPELKLTYMSSGYYVNDDTGTKIETNDNLYIWSKSVNTAIWLASPASSNAYLLFVGKFSTSFSFGASYYANTNYSVRPVVCLKSSIPATTGTTTDFSLNK